MPSWARICPWMSIGNSLGRAWTKSPGRGPTAQCTTPENTGAENDETAGEETTAPPRRQGQFPSLAFPLRLFIVALHPLAPRGRTDGRIGDCTATVGCLRNCMMQARWRRVGWWAGGLAGFGLLDRLSLCFLLVLPAPAGQRHTCTHSRQGRTAGLPIMFVTKAQKPVGVWNGPSPGNPPGTWCLGWVARNTRLLTTYISCLPV